MALVSKTFSQVITFTRASTATFVGSNGLIQSAAIDVPRFDYDPVTLAAKGLLIEESRANLHLYSQDFSTGWAVNNADVTLTGGAATSPDGTTNAGSLLCATTTDAVRRMYASANVTLATSTVYTASIYVKALNWTWASVSLAAGTGFTTNVVLSRVNLSTGATTLQLGTSVTATAVGNGWWRIAIVGTTDAVVTGYRLSVGLLDADESVVSTAVGVVGAGVYVFGAQIEAGAFPTSYIPTVATSLTRSDDRATVAAITPWYNQSQGSWVGQVLSTVPANTGAQRRCMVATFTDVNNYMEFGRGTSATAGPRLVVETAGVAQLGVNGIVKNIGNPAFANPVKLAFAYQTDSYALTGAGQTPTVSTPPNSVPTITTVRLGAGVTLPSTLACLNGHLQRITYYPRRLSDAQLQSITT